jgi:xanthine dehydrogenase YagS FAD-binding subunit
MRPLDFIRAESTDHAVSCLATPSETADSPAPADARVIAGGTNLLDLMKLQIMRPGRLVDINRLALDAIQSTGDGGLRLGATARNADTAYHPLVREGYPLLSAAILAAASAQIRNMASNGGNLLQRTRCSYFYDHAMPCNKRMPGSGCSAIGGLNKYHAILGASSQCIATHPSDMCVALAALEAVVHVQGSGAGRDIAFSDFHRLPGDHPEIDSTLAADELIEYIALPNADRFAAHSAYLKIRERLSYAFGLVSVAAALDLDESGRILQARVALGGVAHKPWRSAQAEQLLTGQVAGREAFQQMADRLLEDAVAQNDNAFKIVLAKRTVVRALEAATAGTAQTHSLALEMRHEG